MFVVAPGQGFVDRSLRFAVEGQPAESEVGELMVVGVGEAQQLALRHLVQAVKRYRAWLRARKVVAGNALVDIATLDRGVALVEAGGVEVVSRAGVEQPVQRH